MKQLWAERLSIGSYEAAKVFTDDLDRLDERPAVSRWIVSIFVRAHAWYDDRTSTLRIDLEAVRVNEYDYHTADSTWDELAPTRLLEVCEDPKTAVYRRIIAVIDAYVAQASARFQGLDVDAGSMSDADILAAWLAERQADRDNEPC